jgi:hypothetical protein
LFCFARLNTPSKTVFSGEENAASVNYMMFPCRAKLLTARLAHLLQRVWQLSLLTLSAFARCFSCLQFFLALLESDADVPPQKAGSILPTMR